jgi:hypothetical protein
MLSKQGGLYCLWIENQRSLRTRRKSTNLTDLSKREVRADNIVSEITSLLLFAHYVVF